VTDRSLVRPPRRLLTAGTTLFVLAVVTVLSVLSLQPPAAVPADAPAGTFSARRAFAEVERVAAEVHVTGSPAADRVREHIVTTLRGYGLAVDVQEATGRNAGKAGEGSLARVRNVVARLPGRAPTGQLILLAHYDSAQVSYGASDDGAGVAALLETARALTAGGPPRNDVLFVLTDAEEACLCGAEAFVSGYPLAQGPAVVLNLEARGSRGPAVMFQTSPGNSAVVDVFGRAAPHPVGTSLAVEVYRLLPNDTDFTPVLDAGRFTGLNSAFIDGSAVYHTPLDRPANLDVRSLQHHGSNTLALAREFGRTDLAPLTRPAAGDATYFPVLGALVRYPDWVGWPLAGLALVAVAVLGLLARRRGLASGPRLLAGVGLALVPLIGAAGAAQLLWAGLVAIRPGYGSMIDPYRPVWLRCAVLALTVAVLLGWYALSRRRIGPAALAIGALGLLAALGVALTAVVPGGAYIVVLPSLTMSAAGIAVLSWRRPTPGPGVDGPPGGAVATGGAMATGGSVAPAHGVGQLALLGLGAVVGVLTLVPVVTLFLPALGLRTGAAPALCAGLLGLTLLPLLEPLWPSVTAARARWIGAAPALTALVLAVTLTAVGLGVDRFDARHPAPTHLVYLLDNDTRSARWASLETRPLAWTRQYVPERGEVSTAFPIVPSGRLAVGPAEVADLPAPTVAVVSDATVNGERTLRLTVTPRRPARLLGFFGAAGERRVVKATVAGRDAVTHLTAADRFGVVFHGPPPGGLDVTLVLRGGEPFALRLLDGSDGLSALPGFRPRPPDVGVLGSHSSELLVTAQTVVL